MRFSASTTASARAEVCDGPPSNGKSACLQSREGPHPAAGDLGEERSRYWFHEASLADPDFAKAHFLGSGPIDVIVSM